jgi:hypothetical protein
MIVLGTAEEIREHASMTGSGLEEVFLRLTGGEDVQDLLKIL